MRSWEDTVIVSAEEEEEYNRDDAIEELKEEDLAEVEAFVEDVLPRLERVKELPDDGEQADDIMAMDKTLDGLPMQIMPDLTPLQHKAACLLGKGWDRREVEQTLNVKPGMVQVWLGENTFNDAVRYYTDLDREDLGRVVHQELRVLLDKDSLTDDTRTKLLKLMVDLGALPHDQRMDIIDRKLKERQVSAEEVQADASMLGVAGDVDVDDIPDDAIDAEFEISDDDDE